MHKVGSETTKSKLTKYNRGMAGFVLLSLFFIIPNIGIWIGEFPSFRSITGLIGSCIIFFLFLWSVISILRLQRRTKRDESSSL